MLKNFLEWFGLKEKIHHVSKGPRLYREGDIWWTALGENVGVEINGKGSMFSRPVLVYKKLSKDGFMAIPLSSQIKYGTWYVSIIFKNQTHSVNLAQVRAISTSRLYSKMGEIHADEYKKVKDGFLRLYS